MGTRIRYQSLDRPLPPSVLQSAVAIRDHWKFFYLPFSFPFFHFLLFGSLLSIEQPFFGEGGGGCSRVNPRWYFFFLDVCVPVRLFVRGSSGRPFPPPLPSFNDRFIVLHGKARLLYR